MCHHVVTSLDDHGSPSLLQARPTTRERALVPVLVFLGMVVSVVSSLGAPLVPTIARTEHVSLATAQWSLTVTLLAGRSRRRPWADWPTDPGAGRSCSAP